MEEWHNEVKVAACGAAWVGGGEASFKSLHPGPGPGPGSHALFSTPLVLGRFLGKYKGKKSIILASSGDGGYEALRCVRWTSMWR
jgi:hypothetical protein